MASRPSKTRTTKDVVPTKENAVPAFLRDRMAEDAGMGVSHDAEDVLIPLIYVLQTNSPQCNRRSPEYVQDAEAGSIWLRGSGLPAIDGEEGLLFQPCYFQKDWVEWKPNRGGFAGRHPDKPANAVEKVVPTDNDPERKAWVLPNGNIVQETRYHIGNVYLTPDTVIPFVIPFTSSGHTVSKQWMLLMQTQKAEGFKGEAPSFACFYRLKTKERSNAKGTWFVFDPQLAGWVQDAEDYERGYALHMAFKAGEKGIETPEEEGSVSSGGSGRHGDDAAM